MKRISFTLIVVLLMSMIITIIGYNELTIRKESEKLQELNLQYQEEPKKEPEATHKTTINCIGDNLTLGTKTSSYPTALSSMLNLPVNKFGGAYDQTIDLSIRTGATKIYVDDITIPSSTTPVEIEIYNQKGDKLNALRSSGNNFSAVEINGISGKLKYDTEKKIHTFTRSQKGEELKITKPTQITAQFPTFEKDDIAIIFTGTYDPQVTNGIFKTITYQRSLIRQLKTKKYIVVSLTSKRRMPIVDDMNKVLAEEHKEHFLDFRSYLLDEGIKDSNITLSSQEKQDLIKRYIPESLLNDDKLVGNAKFNDLLAKQLIEKMIELKYIDEKDIH